MARSFSRAQVLQNRAFLAALARVGNAREAARALGVHRSTMLKRRAKSSAFALFSVGGAAGEALTPLGRSNAN